MSRPGRSPTRTARLLAAGVAGEMVWVGLYVGIGYAFGANLEAATELASSALGLLAALAALAAFGWWLWVPRDAAAVDPRRCRPILKP